MRCSTNWAKVALRCWCKMFGKRSLPHGEEFWSGWEDSNFRPPRPERGALANCATPRSGVLAGIRTLDPLIKSQLLYQLSYQDIYLSTISNFSLFSTPGGTWTHTPLRARDFKSLVSTIPPPEHQNLVGDFERKTRLELATPTLARSCSTNWAISAYFFPQKRVQKYKHFWNWQKKFIFYWQFF